VLISGEGIGTSLAFRWVGVDEILRLRLRMTKMAIMIWYPEWRICQR